MSPWIDLSENSATGCHVLSSVMQHCWHVCLGARLCSVLALGQHSRTVDLCCTSRSGREESKEA